MTRRARTRPDGAPNRRRSFDQKLLLHRLDRLGFPPPERDREYANTTVIQPRASETPDGLRLAEGILIRVCGIEVFGHVRSGVSRLPSSAEVDRTPLVSTRSRS